MTGFALAIVDYVQSTGVVHEVHALALAFNAASSRALEKLGMKRRGTLTSEHAREDSVWFYMRFNSNDEGLHDDSTRTSY